jgi:hypothetical protein
MGKMGHDLRNSRKVGYVTSLSRKLPASDPIINAEKQTGQNAQVFFGNLSLKVGQVFMTFLGVFDVSIFSDSCRRT